MRLPPPSSAVLGALARTRPASEGTALLRSALRARRLVLLKSLLVRARRDRDAVDPTVLRRFETSWHLLEQTERRHPGVVRDLLDYPTTGVWLAVALAGPTGPAFDRHLDRLEVLAVTGALRAGRPLDLAVEAPDGLLSLPGVGRLRLPSAGPVRIRARSRVVRLHAEGGSPAAPTVLLLTDRRAGTLVGRGPAWTGLPLLPGSTARLDDLDPYRVPPGGFGDPLRRAADHTDTDRPGWVAHWRDAHELLARTDSDRAAETRRAVRLLVPLTPNGPRSVGATLSAAPGAVLSSPAAGGPDLAETLVHEIHHGKLATLHEAVPLYRPGRAALHRVGWRPDPRPVAGVFQGAYAHLALADLWRRTATATQVPAPWRTHAGQQFDDIHDQVGEALAILLESDELTNEGREFARQMAGHHASLGAAPRASG
ncbi:HEXXH motif domain-containing protein [Streptomyces sp. NBC_01216]|uniref:HEXXH motif domain-containing protein n=1 Tax=unclassified Streptomyces TaxID=2593676 RepID=UPI002E0E0E27|nr:HEXXH motif domain-containing protein [Streptomyces sp. NBC_01216]